MPANTVIKADMIPKDWNFVSMHAICYKTELFKRNNIKLTEHCFYTDSEYVLYPLVYVQEVMYFPIDLYQYRIGVDGQSVSLAGIRKHLGDLRQVILQINAYFDSYGQMLPESIDYRISALYKNYILGILAQKPSVSMKKQLTNFISGIRKKYPTRYQYIKNRKIQLIALSQGILYWPCIWYMQNIEKDAAYM